MVKRVSVEEYVRITDIIKANRAKINSERLTQPEVIELVSRAMQKRIGLSTVKRCCKIAGVTWGAVSVIPQSIPLEREIIIHMLSAIAYLYQKAGEEPPTKLANMRTQYIQEVRAPEKTVKEPETPDNR